MVNCPRLWQTGYGILVGLNPGRYNVMTCIEKDACVLVEQDRIVMAGQSGSSLPLMMKDTLLWL